MLKDLEFLARKQEQIANRALQLQHENQSRQQQIMQYIQNSDIQSKQNQDLIQENQQLKTQLDQIKQSLKLIYLATEQISTETAVITPTNLVNPIKKTENVPPAITTAAATAAGALGTAAPENTWQSSSEFEESLTKEVEEKLKQALQEAQDIQNIQNADQLNLNTPTSQGYQLPNSIQDQSSVTFSMQESANELNENQMLHPQIETNNTHLVQMAKTQETEQIA
jgi:hypothetical protein